MHSDQGVISFELVFVGQFQSVVVVYVRLGTYGPYENLLPIIAQRTNALTKAAIGSIWVVGRGFESHVPHENAFQKKTNFLM